MIVIDNCQLQIDGDTIWVNGPDARCKLRVKLADTRIPDRMPYLTREQEENFFIDMRVKTEHVSFGEGRR